MRKYFVPGHFIDGEATLKEFDNGIHRFKELMEISRTRGSDLEFGLKLTVDEGNIDQNLQERIAQSINDLPSDLWLLYDPIDRGPGTSLSQILFNTTFLNNIVISVCLDQYVISSEDSLEQLEDLASKVERDNALRAVGSRDVPVILATNERNSNLRVIHELFHSLTIGSNILRIPGQRSNVTPAYEGIGESSSGLQIMNLAHPQYPTLVQAFFKAAQVADFKGFAAEYYTVLKSAELDKTLTGYVMARENPFSHRKDEKEEFDFVTRGIIRYQTGQLGKTDVRGKLLKTLQAKESQSRLAEFYPRPDVELVRDLMIDSLH